MVKKQLFSISYKQILNIIVFNKTELISMTKLQEKSRKKITEYLSNIKN